MLPVSAIGSDVAVDELLQRMHFEKRPEMGAHVRRVGKAETTRVTAIPAMARALEKQGFEHKPAFSILVLMMFPACAGNLTLPCFRSMQVDFEVVAPAIA